MYRFIKARSEAEISAVIKVIKENGGKLNFDYRVDGVVYITPRFAMLKTENGTILGDMNRAVDRVRARKTP